MADSDAAQAQCAPGSGALVQLDLVFHNAAGQRTLLTLRPSSTDVERGWRPAEFTLMMNGHDPVVRDGAIIVVSAIEGPRR